MGGQALAGAEINIYLGTMYLDPRSVSLITQAKVNSQVIGCTPVVLEICSKHAGALAPFAAANAPAVVYRQPQVEIRTTVASIATGSRGRGGEYTPEINAPQSSVIPSVKGIDAVAPELKSGVEDVAVLRGGGRICRFG